MPHRQPRPKPVRFVFAPPVSNEFPLWDVEPGDVEELEANLIEGAALLTRCRDHVLRRHAPLSRIAAYKPTGADRPLSEMSATELALLVDELREKAAKARALAAIQAEMVAAE